MYGFNHDAPSEKNKFYELKQKVDEGLSGSLLARDRSCSVLTSVMIPEALDYPM